MAGFNTEDVAGHQRAAHIDGHGVNAAYKAPKLAASNPSHMEGPKLNFEKAWSSADKTLQESARPKEQLGVSKTVFPVNTGKVRGAPKPPGASRADSHSPAAIPGPAKPTLG